MNARQKAKKYKKYIKTLEAEVAICGIAQRAEAFRRATAIGTLETFKICKYWDDRIPEDFVKREIAEEIARFMIENNMIHWEVENGYNERMLRRITGTVRAARNGGWEE